MLQGSKSAKFGFDFRPVIIIIIIIIIIIHEFHRDASLEQNVMRSDFKMERLIENLKDMHRERR